MNRLFSTRRYYSKTSSHISLSLSLSLASPSASFSQTNTTTTSSFLYLTCTANDKPCFSIPPRSAAQETHTTRRRRRTYLAAKASEERPQTTQFNSLQHIKYQHFPIFLTTFLLSRRVVGRQAESLMSFCGHLLSPHVNCEPKSTDLPTPL